MLKRTSRTRKNVLTSSTCSVSNSPPYLFLMLSMRLKLHISTSCRTVLGTSKVPGLFDLAARLRTFTICLSGSFFLHDGSIVNHSFNSASRTMASEVHTNPISACARMPNSILSLQKFGTWTMVIPMFRVQYHQLKKELK